MSFVNQYRSTTVFGELKVQKFNTGNINGLLDISGNTILRGDCTINGNLLATDGTVDVSGNLETTGDAKINSLTVGRGGGNIDDNTALGGGALSVNTTGTNNTALGKDALLNNTTGSSNTAVGYGALETNITGGNNTAVGRNVLLVNTGGSNTGMGFEALNANTTGSDNTAVGHSSMTVNISGSNNVAVGNDALDENTSGSFNVAIGDGAGRINKTGNNNTFLGYNTDISGNLVYNNSTAIGTGAIIDASNCIVIGTANENVKIRGALNVSGNITGNLTGTATKVRVIDETTNLNDNYCIPYSQVPTDIFITTDSELGIDPSFNFNPSTNTLSVTNIIGNLTGTATNVNVTAVNTNSNFSVPFLSGATGSQTISSDTGILYNPSTETLSVTNINGVILNNATTMTIATDSSNQSFFPVFVSTTTGNLPPKVDAGISYNPSSNLLTTTVSNVNVTAVNTNTNFRVPFLSATTGSATISSDGGILYNPNTNRLTVGQLEVTSTPLLSAYVGGVWLVAIGEIDVFYPITTSQTNLGDVCSQSTLGTYAKQDTGLGNAGSYSTVEFNNRVDRVIVYPNWGIVAFANASYAGTLLINYRNSFDFPVSVDVQGGGVDTMSSCKIFLDSVEQT